MNYNNNNQQYYQQFSVQQPQPAPIGSLLNNNTGYRGYIGYQQPGVYNGYYGNRFINPYQVAQQQQQYQNQMKTKQEQMINLIKSIVKTSIKSTYPDIKEEEYKKIMDQFNPEIAKKQYQEHCEYDQLKYLYNNQQRLSSSVVNPEAYRLTMNIQAIRDYNRSKMNQNAGLLDFLNNSKYLSDALEEEERAKNRKSGINRLYNGDQYNQLINMHSNNSNYFFNALGAAQATDIDDNTVVLPDSIRYSENAKRREQFLNTILNKS